MSPRAATSAIAQARRTVDHVRLLARDARKLERENQHLRERIAELEAQVDTTCTARPALEASA